jgi:hypothetical protein
VLSDYHPNIAVILPTTDGAGSVAARTLMPLAGTWTVDGGTQWFEPAIFGSRPAAPTPSQVRRRQNTRTAPRSASSGLCLQVTQGDHRRHRCGSGLVALVLAGALEPRAVKRLLLVVTGEDAETDRYASPDADIS